MQSKKVNTKPEEVEDYWGLKRLFGEKVEKKPRTLIDIYEEEIKNLEEQIDYAKKQIKEIKRYSDRDIGALESKIGKMAYQLNYYRRLVAEEEKCGANNEI